MLKLRIGRRLQVAREEKKLSQAEMAEMLGISPSTYSRLERNENAVEYEQLVHFAKTLQIPIQEFFPETTAIHNNHSGQGGVIFGNFYYYGNRDEAFKELEMEVKILKEKIESQRKEIELLREMLELSKSK